MSYSIWKFLSFLNLRTLKFGEFGAIICKCLLLFSSLLFLDSHIHVLVFSVVPRKSFGLCSLFSSRFFCFCNLIISNNWSSSPLNLYSAWYSLVLIPCSEFFNSVILQIQNFFCFYFRVSVSLLKFLFLHA